MILKLSFSTCSKILKSGEITADAALIINNINERLLICIVLGYTPQFTISNCCLKPSCHGIDKIQLLFNDITNVSIDDEMINLILVNDAQGNIAYGRVGRKEFTKRCVKPTLQMNFVIHCFNSEKK